MRIHTRPYERLKFYQNISELRKLINKITNRFDKENLRLISQMRDAARSAKQNIREGYRRGGAKEFVHYLNIARGSLEELGGDINDCLEDGLIDKEEHSMLTKLVESSDYMIAQYIQSLFKMESDGTWKVPNKTKKLKQ